MKRDLVLATAAAAVLIGGGTASAVALADDGDGPSKSPTPPRHTAPAADGREDRDVDAPDTDRDARERDGDEDRDAGGRGGREGSDDREDAAEARAARGAGIDVRRAVDAALKARPGTVVAVELDADDGARARWEVEILGSDGRWYELSLDGDTGAVLRQDRDDQDDDAAPLGKAVREAGTSATEAAASALRRVPGTVTSVELDADARPSWEVEILGRGDGTADRDREVHVDPRSGAATERGDTDRGDDRDDD
ncbi:PepSY domain-containing protein [Streptomyces sp. NPDC057702]|uniref:PepSY domain-containing protein n=1 Tax=unclassified Streptomyces TaxID=2593676 RepID=UPI00367736FF